MIYEGINRIDLDSLINDYRLIKNSIPPSDFDLIWTAFCGIYAAMLSSGNSIEGFHKSMDFWIRQSFEHNKERLKAIGEENCNLPGDWRDLFKQNYPVVIAQTKKNFQFGKTTYWQVNRIKDPEKDYYFFGFCPGALVFYASYGLFMAIGEFSRAEKIYAKGINNYARDIGIDWIGRTFHRQFHRVCPKPN